MPSDIIIILIIFKYDEVTVIFARCKRWRRNTAKSVTETTQCYLFTRATK